LDILQAIFHPRCVVMVRIRVKVTLSVNRVRVRLMVSVNMVTVRMGTENSMSCIFVHPRRKITPCLTHRTANHREVT